MSTPVTADEVMRGAEVWHDQSLCVITDKRPTEGGGVYIEWTENLCGRETLFGGSFAPGAYFGEETFI